MTDQSEPSITAIKTLFALSRNVCAFPGCEVKLTDPAWRQVKARICHIHAKSPGGPRYDPSMTNEERHAFENLILLCPNHHTEIDDVDPDRYPPEALYQMKATAESYPATLWCSEAVLTASANRLLTVMRWLDKAGPLPGHVEVQGATASAGGAFHESVSEPFADRPSEDPNGGTIRTTTTFGEVESGDQGVTDPATAPATREGRESLLLGLSGLQGRTLQGEGLQGGIGPAGGHIELEGA